MGSRVDVATPGASNCKKMMRMRRTTPGTVPLVQLLVELVEGNPDIMDLFLDISSCVQANEAYNTQARRS